MVYFGADAHITNATNAANATSWNMTETATFDVDLPAIFGKKHLISEEVLLPEKNLDVLNWYLLGLVDSQVGLYTKLMALTAVLTIIDMHLEVILSRIFASTIMLGLHRTRSRVE